MKGWQVVVILVVAVIVAITLYIGLSKPNSLQAVNWPMRQEWRSQFGSCPQSQRDYDLWLLGQFFRQQRDLNAHLITAINTIDPNLLADPNQITR